MASWDVNRVRAQLRLTAQRLGQLQDKMEAQGQITRRDISTLLQQGNVILARAKAQKIIREDIYGDLLQIIEMQVGIIVEHIGEFERSVTPSPIVVEAASSIIYAAPRIDSRDLHIVRELLMQQLGPDFVRAALDTSSGYVSARVLRAMSAPTPSASTLDRFLFSVARMGNVQWLPDYQPNEKVDAISSMLESSSTADIDITRLRNLCSHGLPEYPPWLRPRVWRLLLGTLPLNKKTWSNDAQKQRENYYDLLRRLLEPFDKSPPPTQPLASLDVSLMEVSNALSRVPRDLYAKLEEEPDKSDHCPLDEAAPEDVRIACASYLDARVRLIRESETPDKASAEDGTPEIRLDSTPEIRLEVSEDEPNSQPQSTETDRVDTNPGTPEISLSTPDSPTSSSVNAPTTLLRSRSHTTSVAHPKHASALLRLLYVHSVLNPANRSPQVASLLVPLYTALVEEIEPDDAAHVEADAFWIFETMVGEFSELEEVEGANVWMRKLSERLRNADTELAEDLQLKGLDPALPHYSYRWLTTLLTHALPLADVLTVWDAIFSRPRMERDLNPKLDYLLDICTSMLICTRSSLIRLGRPPVRYLNVDENASLIATPLGERELEEAFIQGMAFLQSYPLQEAGGIERVIQLAFDLSKQRESQAAAATTNVTAGFAARWRNTVWKPAAPVAAPIVEVREEENSDDSSTDSDSEYEAPARAKTSIPSDVPATQTSTLGSRLAETVWKGITNQAAMEPPPSPMSSSLSPSPDQSPAKVPISLPEPAEHPTPESDASAAANKRNSGSSLWGYAEKLRDSDAAATIAKVSTNWRVKAWDAWSKRGNPGEQNAPAGPSTLSPSWMPSPSNRASVDIRASPRVYDPKRSSLPERDHADEYSPPPRPAFFRPPRDSMLPSPRDTIPSPSPTGSDFSARSQGSHDSLKGRRESTGLSSSGTRVGGPRPLLLGSVPLITHSRSPTPVSMDAQFAHAVRERRPQHRSSQSSVSSLSPSEHSGRPRVMDTTISRVVPLNRKAASPMARTRRPESLSSVSSPSGSVLRLPADTSPESDDLHSMERSQWRSAEAVDDAASKGSPPPLPGTPPNAGADSSVRVVVPETQRGSVVLSEFGELDSASMSDRTPKVHRKMNSSLSRVQTDDSSDSSAHSQLPSRNPRVRSKRHPPRLADIRTRENSKGSISGERVPSPNTLAAPEWPEEGDATTPRAATFETSTSPSGSLRRTRKTSGESRTRKISTDGSSHPRRKVSSERREVKHKRESSAIEGDDEGYDDLLSAYESEDSVALR